MAFEVETGAGSATATSYCSVAFADTYHAKNRISAATWAALSTANKQYRLETATELLDRACEWEGQPSEDIPDEQALQWPRYGCVDRNGWAVDSNVIPEDLKRATADLAYRLQVADLDKDPTRGISEIKAGEVGIVFDPTRTQPVLPRSVKEYLRSFLRNGGSAAFGTARR